LATHPDFRFRLTSLEQMGRPPRVQIIRTRRGDGTTTFALRLRLGGTDERILLGNEKEGWDELRVDQARKQLLAKIELGLWTPQPASVVGPFDEEPTFRELATDWLEARRRNPAIRPRTIELNEMQLRRYLAPFFGELLPSKITRGKIKEYRPRIHIENEQIRAAEAAGRPLRDASNGRRLRTLSNESINKTLQTLAVILDEAEDAGWITQNVARARRMREPPQRRRATGALDVDEFLDLLDAAGRLDGSRHKEETIERAAVVQDLRDRQGLNWSEIAQRMNVAAASAVYLYGVAHEDAHPRYGVRRAIIATLGLAGPRVSELCLLDNVDVDLAKARLHIRDAKTEAGVRPVDIHPRLLDELTSYRGHRAGAPADAPAFPTRHGTRQNKDNIRQHVVEPAVALANKLRAERGEPPIRTHVTPHALRRTYVSYAITAGFDIPYVQAQVGHVDPKMTLAVYAKVMRRPDRGELQVEIRSLLGVDRPRAQGPSETVVTRSQGPTPTPFASRIKATKGHNLSR
jgi:integrase